MRLVRSNRRKTKVWSWELEAVMAVESLEKHCRLGTSRLGRTELRPRFSCEKKTSHTAVASHGRSSELHPIVASGGETFGGVRQRATSHINDIIANCLS